MRKLVLLMCFLACMMVPIGGICLTSTAAEVKFLQGFDSALKSGQETNAVAEGSERKKIMHRASASRADDIYEENEKVFYGEQFSPTGQYYVVRFVDYDGRPIVTQLVKDGSPATRPEEPTRAATEEEGYAFAGWQGNPEGITDACITGDVCFTATYRVLQKIALRIEYRVDEPNAQITAPPTKVFSFVAGEQVHIFEPSPLLMGYKPDVAVAIIDGVVSAGMPPVIVTYFKAVDPIDYQIRYFQEKLGVSEAPEVGNKEQFDEIFADAQSGSGQYGFLFAPDKQYPGFLPMTQAVEPLVDTTVYEVYYQRKTTHISFETGEGVSYHPPLAGKYGSPATLPTPTRAGYTFAGWSPTLTAFPAEDCVLHAQWTPQNVAVKLIYWIEKADMGIDFDPDISDHTHFTMINLSSGLICPDNPVAEIFLPAGSIPYIETAPPLLTREYKTPVADYIGYTASDETVSGDGTTIINLYYQRRVFSWLFEAIQGGTKEGYFPDGKTTYEVFFKFEENVEDRWPKGTKWEPRTAAGECVYVWRSDEVCWPAPEHLRKPLATDGLLPRTGNCARWELWWIDDTPDYLKYLSCYFELLPGEGPSEGHDILTGDDETVYIRDGGGQNFSQEYFNPYYMTYFLIYGMDYPEEHSTSQKGNEVYLFKRLKYTIAFDTGSAGTQISAPAAFPNVSYQSPLAYYVPSDWVPGVTSYTDQDTGVVYTFDGWYKQRELYQPVDFSTQTMPGYGVTLFAKWVSSNVSVTFKYPDGTIFETIEGIPAGSSMLDYFPNAEPSLPGMLFTGWYNGDSRFTPLSRVVEDSEIVAHFEPLTFSYQVHYRYNTAEGWDIWPTKTIPGRYIGECIAALVDELPVGVPGYVFVGAKEPSVTITEDAEANKLIFLYEYSGAKQGAYQVRYLLEGTDEPVPTLAQPGVQWTSQMVVVAWALQDTSGMYYPVTEYRMGKPSADGVTYIDIYYRAYETVTYTETIYLVGSKNNGAVIHTETRAGKVGEMVAVQYADTAYIDPEGVKYVYNETAPNTVNRVIIQGGNDHFELRRYFYQTYAVAFVSNNPTYGTLDGQTHFSDVRHGTTLGEIVKPTPIPAENCYFAGWQGAFAMGITEDCQFVAEFVPKEILLIQADSYETVYDGQEHTLANGVTLSIGGVPAPFLTVSGITVSGACGINAGSYPNVISNKDALLITDDTMQDVTGLFIPLFEDGCLTIQRKGGGHGEDDFFGTITIDPQYKVVDKPDPELTCTTDFSGVVEGDALSFQLRREPGEEIGQYLISAVWDEGFPTQNYDLSAVEIIEAYLTIDGLLRIVEPDPGINGMDMDFGEQYLPVGAAEYQSTAESHLLRVEDSRLLPSPWSVQVAIGSFVGEDGSSFGGAIALSTPVSTHGELDIESAITMISGGDAAQVMAANGELGNGTFDVSWRGTDTQFLLASGEMASVRQTSYQAEIVWTIVSGP